MKIKRISIFSEFRCTAEKCPANCCRNSWKIPIDPDMYTKYCHEKGPLGLLLRCSAIKRHGIATFRNTFQGCPFWGTDHLCNLQKKCGVSYMPVVCRQFPRQLYNLKFFCEETLYLACPESARLFLEFCTEDKPFTFTVTEENVSYKVNTTNDDKAFLDELLNARNELITMLKEGVSFDSMAILKYGQDAQNACLIQKPLPSPLNYESREKYRLTCEKTDHMLFNGFYHPRLRTVSPHLYSLCQRYIRNFGRPGRKNTVDANRKLAALKENLYQKLPDLDKLLNRYYEYYLLTHFLDIYESYDFLKCLFYGIAKSNLLWLLVALYAEDQETLNIPELAIVLAVYERRAPQIQTGLFHLDAFQ